MKTCYECGKKLVEKKSFHWKNERLGLFYLFKGKHWKCEKCAEVFIPLSTVMQIEEMEEKRTSELLCNLFTGINELDNIFLSNKELVAILGKTRQAISKNPRIKTLIYNFTLKGTTYYLRESVECFKATGDGRIKLAKEEESYKALVIDQMIDTNSTTASSGLLTNSTTVFNGSLTNSTTAFSGSLASQEAETAVMGG